MIHGLLLAVAIAAGATPSADELLAAVTRGDVRAVERLLAAGAPPAAVVTPPAQTGLWGLFRRLTSGPPQPTTPLHAATQRALDGAPDGLGVVDRLLRAGADADVDPGDGIPPLRLVARAAADVDPRRSAPLADALLKAGATPDAALGDLAGQGGPAVRALAARLLDAGADPLAGLCAAAVAGDAALAADALRHPPPDLDAACPGRGPSALHLSATGDGALVPLLRAAGADPTRLDHRGRTVIEDAAAAHLAALADPSSDGAALAAALRRGVDTTEADRLGLDPSWGSLDAPAFAARFSPADWLAVGASIGADGLRHAPRALGVDQRDAWSARLDCPLRPDLGRAELERLLGPTRDRPAGAWWTTRHGAHTATWSRGPDGTRLLAVLPAPGACALLPVQPEGLARGAVRLALGPADAAFHTADRWTFPDGAGAYELGYEDGAVVVTVWRAAP